MLPTSGINQSDRAKNVTDGPGFGEASVEKVAGCVYPSFHEDLTHSTKKIDVWKSRTKGGPLRRQPRLIRPRGAIRAKRAICLVRYAGAPFVQEARRGLRTPTRPLQSTAKKTKTKGRGAFEHRPKLLHAPRRLAKEFAGYTKFAPS